MTENLFHKSIEKLKEDCIELRKLLLHWYDDRYAPKVYLLIYKWL